MVTDMSLVWKSVRSDSNSDQWADSCYLSGAYYVVWPAGGDKWSLRLHYRTGDRVDWTTFDSEADAKREAQEHDTGYAPRSE